MAVETTPSMPASPHGQHLAAGADFPRIRPCAGHHQVEVADRVGGADDELTAGRQRAGDGVRRQCGLFREQCVEPPTHGGVRLAPGREPGGVVGAVNVEPRDERTVDGERPLRPRAAYGPGDDLDVPPTDKLHDRP